jgi:hypothetical protein
VLLIGITVSTGFRCAAQQTSTPATTEGDFVAHDFKFRSAESLPELRLHYTTLGNPARDAQGQVMNAVLILHGTGGSGQQFLQPQFAGVLFGPGQLLDTTHYFIILPDGIGHGKSSKPSNGLHAHFPQYDYDDMVLAHYRLLTEGLSVNHLRLILGTSMGMEERGVHERAAAGFARRAGPPADRRHRAPADAEKFADARCGGQIPGRLLQLASRGARRQRSLVPGECVAQLRSVAAARKNQGPHHVD